jgi:hypothetical protein
MQCPRCGSQHIKCSQSHDALWRRLLLHRRLRCYRCCYVFTSPIWTVPASPQDGVDLTVEAEAVAVSLSR